MSYLVLARKYRPQSFAEVVGQEHVTKTLANAFSQDRVHHAFLFCGPRGCGKTTTARILAKALNCATGPSATPCGTCESCVSIANGTAVDYFEMDGASNRGIDSIRDLTEAVRYQPAVMRKKVYVIDEVHMLTTEAFNALLKTLEEPPPHVTFVMATTEPHKVPNTILSRCQRFDFKLVPNAGLAQHLGAIFQREEIPIDAGALNLIVRESGGSVRDALSLCDQLISYVGTDGISEAKVAEVLGVADRTLVRNLVRALAVSDAATALEAVDAAIARGVDEVQIARAVVRYLRDLAVAQVAPDSESLIDGAAEERREIVEMARDLAPSKVRQMFDRMLKTCDELGESSQPRLVLDLGLIDVAASEETMPLGALIGRLGAMEKRLSGGGSSGGGQPSTSGSGASPAGRPTPSGRASAPASPAPASPALAPSALASPAPASPAPASSVVPTQSSAEASAAATDIAGASDGPEPTAPVSAESADRTAPPGHNTTPSSGPLRAWEGVIAGLETAKEFGLMTIYQTAKVLSFDNDAVCIGFAEGGLTAEIAGDKEKCARMQTFIRTHLGKPVQFHVKILSAAEDAAALSLQADANARAAEENQQRLEEAKEHPMTKKVLRTFGAKVQEIKVKHV